MAPRKAFILAAGLGTRLRPYTDDCPKPMIDVGGRTLIDRTLDSLEEAGIADVVINTHYLAQKLETHLARRPAPGIHVSREETILGTGGGIRKMLPFFAGEDFFVLSGDGLWSEGPGKPALHRLSGSWNPRDMDILILLQPVRSMTLTEGTGDYDLDSGGRAVRSINKQGTYMFTSIRINTPAIFKDAPEGAFSYLDLMDRAEKAGRLFGLVHEGEWHHISTPPDLEAVRASGHFG